MLQETYCLAGAGGGGVPQGSIIMLLWPWIIIFGIFYLLIFRPQRMKQKELEKTISGLEKGDRIVTSGGLLGVVTSPKEKTVVVKIADNVKVEILRSSITHVEKTKSSSS